MTKLMDEVLEKMRLLPEDTQDEIARLLHSIIAEEEAVDDLSPEQDKLLRGRLAEADRREFATTAEMEAVFAKFRA